MGLLWRSTIKNICTNLKTIQQYHSTGLLSILFTLLTMLIVDWLCLVTLVFCCTNGGMYMLVVYNYRKNWKKETAYIYYYFVHWFGSLLQETILGTFLRRLGKGFILPFRHLLYSENCGTLLRVTEGPVRNMDSSGCPSCGHLLPGSKCLPEDEGLASWGRHTVVPGRNMTNVRLFHLKQNLPCWRCLMFLGHRRDKHTDSIAINTPRMRNKTICVSRYVCIQINGKPGEGHKKCGKRNPSGATEK